MDEMVSKFLYKCNQWWDFYEHLVYTHKTNTYTITICIWEQNKQMPNFPTCINTCQISFLVTKSNNIRRLERIVSEYWVREFILRSNLVYLGCDDELVNYFSSKAKEFLVNKLSKQEEEIDLLPEYL